MTTNMKLFTLAAAASLLSACTHEDELQDNPVEARITASVNRTMARAAGDGWNADHIGVMALDEGTTMARKYKNVEYLTTSTGAYADFTPATAGNGIFFEDASREFTFAAYAPFAPSASASSLPGDNGKIAVNTERQPTGQDQEVIDFLFATGAKASKSNPVISFTDHSATGGSNSSFKHKMARLVLKVQVSDADGFTDPSVLQFAGYKLGGLIHEGTFDVLTGTATATGAVVSDWVLAETTYPTPSTPTATYNCVADYDDSTGMMTLTMILLPQTLTDFLHFEVAPDDGEGQTYANKDLIKPALEAGFSYTYTIMVKKTGLTLTGSTIENWSDGGTHAGDARM